MFYEINIGGWEESYHIFVESDEPYVELKPKIDKFILEAVKSKVKKETKRKNKYKSYIEKKDILDELVIVLKKNGIKTIKTININYGFPNVIRNSDDNDMPGSEIVVKYNNSIVWRD